MTMLVVPKDGKKYRDNSITSGGNSNNFALKDAYKNNISLAK